MDQFGVIPNGVLVQPEPFNLHVPEKDIAEFKTLLNLSKIGPVTWENSSEKFGITRNWLIEAKDTWLNKFNWRKHERRINSFPNFKTIINDTIHGELGIHFIGLFSTRREAVPLMMMHGWPGSFLEFLPILNLLAKKYNPENLPYHIVVPSLPGYTLSDGPPLDKDFTLEDLTRIMNQLMISLGFGKRGYVAQGGDLGSIVTRMLAAFPECKAIHVNMIMLDQENVTSTTEGLSKRDLDGLTVQAQWLETSGGYLVEQSTRPGTIGLILSSNPLALLLWTGAKFLEWSDHNQPLDLDTILCNVSLYWFTNTFPRSIYPYRGLRTMKFPSVGTKPFGYSRFPAEVLFMPFKWCKELYPDMMYYEHEKGGHFAALEQPELLLQDVEYFVAKHT